MSERRATVSAAVLAAPDRGIEDIGREFGISASRVSQIMKAEGVKRPPLRKEPRWTEESRAAASERMRESWKSGAHASGRMTWTPELDAALIELRSKVKYPAFRTVAPRVIGAGDNAIRRRLRELGLVLALFWGGAAVAAPPPGTDPNSDVSRWVRGLQTPPITYNYGDGKTNTMRSQCCGISDCRPTAMRIIDDVAEVWIGKDEYGPDAPDAWVPVPEQVMADTKSDGPPPDGRVWACWYNSQVRCFVPGWGG